MIAASRDIWQIYHPPPFPLPLPPPTSLVPGVVLAVAVVRVKLHWEGPQIWSDRRMIGPRRGGKQTRQHDTSQTSHLATARAGLPSPGRGWIIQFSPGPGTDYHLVQFWSHCIHTSPFRLRSLIHYSIHCIPLFLNKKKIIFLTARDSKHGEHLGPWNKSSQQLNNNQVFFSSQPS